MPHSWDHPEHEHTGNTGPDPATRTEGRQNRVFGLISPRRVGNQGRKGGTNRSVAGRDACLRLTLRVARNTAAVQFSFSGVTAEDTQGHTGSTRVNPGPPGLPDSSEDTGAPHPSSTLQSGTQRPPRLTRRQDTHISGPGPQQPWSEHSGSQVCRCCSVATAPFYRRSWYIAEQPRPRLTAHVHRLVVADVGGLLSGPEEVCPLEGLQEAELRVVLHHHPACTHFFQGAETKPAEMFGPGNNQTGPPDMKHDVNGMDPDYSAARWW